MICFADYYIDVTHYWTKELYGRCKATRKGQNITRLSQNKIEKDK